MGRLREAAEGGQARGKLRGIGLAMFLEPSGGMGKEQVELRVEPDGRRRDVFRWPVRRGRGTRRCFRRWSPNVLGFPEDRIELRVNDVTTPKFLGTGTFGSRSLISHGAALVAGAKEIVEKGEELAATRARGRRPAT